MTEKKLSAERMRVIEIKEQIPDFERLPAADITKILAASIIFENGDLTSAFMLLTMLIVIGTMGLIY